MSNQAIANHESRITQCLKTTKRQTLVRGDNGRRNADPRETQKFETSPESFKQLHLCGSIYGDISKAQPQCPDEFQGFYEPECSKGLRRLSLTIKMPGRYIGGRHGASRHGMGEQTYANGDVYKGYWNMNLQVKPEPWALNAELGIIERPFQWTFDIEIIQKLDVFGRCELFP